ncbi:MAG: chromate efflux transporter [Planctomycetes bacterium]|nr:chromate efflux transporter [Planctomycetota bacterium]
MPSRPSVAEIFLVALRLGCTAFGGPVAHLAYFRAEYVVRRRWLDEAHYADLVALCQFLPGPASSQAGFGIGFTLRGWAGGLAAWLGFTLPAAALMLGFAYGVMSLDDLAGAGWLRGLKVAAVAVVAHAVWTMWRLLCPDPARSVLAGLCAALLLLLPFAWTQLAVIAAGAAFGWLGRKPVLPANGANPEERNAVESAPARPPGHVATICLALFFALLLVLPALARRTNLPALDVLDRFYRAGAMVFGGGHVVLPLLEREVVTPGWVSHDMFLAGYGAAQAVPGPLFTFSAYLGAVTNHGPDGVAGGLWALAAIFLPALLLVAGTLRSWHGLRRRPGAQAALRGANAAVVGLLLAALFHPVGTAGISDGRTALVAAAGLAGLLTGRVPGWALAGACALLGAVWF